MIGVSIFYLISVTLTQFSVCLTWTWC